MDRYIAHITFETKTPLKVGGGEDFLTDLAVVRDFNELPFILGTSIAGVLRSQFDDKLRDEVFGKDTGSKVIVSNALLLNEKNDVVENLLLEKSKFLKLFDNLPVREHTAINDKGVVVEHSKFDEEVVYSGSRFKFSIEVLDDEDSFKKIIEIIRKNSFRLGGGSTKGFGAIKIIEIKAKKFDTKSYIDYESSLNYQFDDEYNFSLELIDDESKIKYELLIKPDDFFIFGSGFGDNEADLAPVFESEIDYENGRLSEKEILIPASSIKGAIAHRVAFYWNKKKNLRDVGEDNEALRELFGNKKDKEKEAKAGKVLFNDCYKEFNNNLKVFNHVKIDRFTAGAIEGALFQEKTIKDNREYHIEIFADKELNKEYLECLELALKDITKGRLGLGGMNAKGHGFFTGKLLRNGEEI